jgi:LuxR family transcriptional regulator, maltose regulon positive regulatory protein
VPRPRLLRRLTETQDAPFVLLVAPAGYGKTTLLSEWAAHDGRRFAWIELAAWDHDPARLVRTVARRAHADAPPTVLVVDNAHALSGAEAEAVLEAVARSLPSGSQLALASRCEPGLPVGSLRAHRRVIELRTADMAMTRSEAAALIDAAGIRLTDDELALLLQRTEGWPAGLYLATLSLRAQPDTAAALSRFAGDDRVVADYLRDELLAPMAPESVAFLTRTSILDTLSGSLCDAVLGDRESGRMLARLARSNILLVSLDRSGDSYRYHTLFKQMLQAELRRLEPQLEPELHVRASAWYERAGDVDRAVRHAVTAGDVERSGDLLWRHAGTYIGQGRNDALQGWLERFTDDQIAASPSLALTAANCRLAAGDGSGAGHWAAAATRGLTRAPSAHPRPLDPAVILLRAAIAEHGLAEMRRDAEHARQLEPEHGSSESFSCLLGGVAHHLSGNSERARSELQDGVRLSAVGAPQVQVLCLAQLALLELDKDDWQSGGVLIARARSRVEACGLDQYPAAALIYAVSALLRSHEGPVDEAHHDLRASRRLIGRLIDFVPWYEAEARVALARAALGLSDVAGARTLLGEASRLVRRVPEAPTLARWLAEATEQLEAASGSAGDGLTLTAAELKVLHMLPTHLSFPAIARQLFVSPNTVKTHVRSLYRKLDATSRAEAVAQAIAAGLLDGLRAA